jgi:hypothetical protein
VTARLRPAYVSSLARLRPQYETPLPTLTALTPTGVTSTTAQPRYGRAGGAAYGTIYAVIYPSALGSGVTAAQIKAGNDPSDDAATWAGNIPDPGGTGTLNWPSIASGLTPGESYYFAIVASDGSNDGTVSVSAAWSALATVQADSSLAYAVLNSVQRDQALSYSVLNAVQRDATISYGVKAAVQQDATLSYLVQSSVWRDADLAWSVFSSGGGLTVDEIWNGITLENGMTPAQMLRVIMAALSGTTSGVGTATEEYMSRDGSKPRITATFDSQGNRTSVQVDGT